MVLDLTTLHWITHKGVNSWVRIAFLLSAATSCSWFSSRSGTLWKFPSSASSHSLVLPLFWCCLLLDLSISRWESFIAGFLLFWFLQSFLSPPLTCFLRHRCRNPLIRIYLLCMWVYNMCIYESAKHGVHVEVIEQPVLFLLHSMGSGDQTQVPPVLQVSCFYLLSHLTD